jgi:methionine-rich copper-binding protein CopC
LVALALMFVLVGTVSAHANLVRSTPAAGALLDAAPKELVLEFSEELDAGFSRVQLYNSKNQVINPGPGVVDPSAPTIMRLTLGELPKDSYTALWRSRSAADGHVTEGSVPFGVGVAATATSLIPALGAPDPATEAPPPGALSRCRRVAERHRPGISRSQLTSTTRRTNAVVCRNSPASERGTLRSYSGPPAALVSVLPHLNTPTVCRDYRWNSVVIGWAAFAQPSGGRPSRSSLVRRVEQWS